MLGVVGGTEDSLFALADSDTGGVEIEDVQAVAQTALAPADGARHRADPARAPGAGGRAADENGRVLGVAVFADELSDVQANVSLVRRRILVAGAVAFGIAVLLGYLVARALSLRVNRMSARAQGRRR